MRFVRCGWIILLLGHLINMNKILVIDNEFEIVQLISDILLTQNYEVKTELNGKSGIKSAFKFNPDIILCDISMPETDGYAVLRALRRDSRTYAIPFIFLTALGGMQDLRKRMRLGADDYLTKPVSADELIATVRTRLEKHEQITHHYKSEIEQTKYDLEITRNYDETTNLPKKAVLERKLINHASDNPAKLNTVLLIIKLNRFKNFIDIFGKNDYILLIHELARRIEYVTDTKKNIYLLNDDEMAIPLCLAVRRKTLTQLVKKILATIRLPVVLEKQDINCNASIGISICSNKNINPAELISNAEIALNAALQDGYNTFKYYGERLKEHAIDLLNLENALHKALEREEFMIYYQPKIDSAHQSIIGSEALLRWENADYGLISPSQFIPLAEENGLIIPIGDWLLESICNQLNDWKSSGINPAPVAINISARQLEQNNFVRSISTILEKTNIENELLEIELTESILIPNSTKNSKKLFKLRKSGTKVSIDDFGTGYSSLAYLTNFPFDKLKIDQSFIRDIVTDKAAAALATSIISMAHGLGVRVIAEGVETKAQLNFLKDYKCDEIQGYYFSEPIPAEKFTEMLKNNSTSF
jgi:EAL domain-containing protein (putative c-di-GMP-specific phosphodiesterase class I)/PleD family two-component response regulator